MLSGFLPKRSCLRIVILSEAPTDRETRSRRIYALL